MSCFLQDANVRRRKLRSQAPAQPIRAGLCQLLSFVGADGSCLGSRTGPTLRTLGQIGLLLGEAVVQAVDFGDEREILFV